MKIMIPNDTFLKSYRLTYKACIVKLTMKNMPKTRIRPTIKTNFIVKGVRQEASPKSELADKMKLAPKSFLCV